MFLSSAFKSCLPWSSKGAGVVLAMLLISRAVWAQTGDAPPPPVVKNPATGASALGARQGVFELFSGRTPYEFWLAVLAAFTGLVIIGLMVWTVRHMERVRPEDITRPAIVITIIVGALLLIIAGYSSEQIAPGFGLFGTIVGYMLGRMSSAAAPPVHAADVSHEAGPSGGKAAASAGGAT